MVNKESRIRLSSGLQARQATLFVQKANQFHSRLMLAHQEKEVNAKSVMGVMSLALRRDSYIRLTADGPDEEEALVALIAFMEQAS